jgi:hypothetical protein
MHLIWLGERRDCETGCPAAGNVKRPPTARVAGAQAVTGQNFYTNIPLQMCRSAGYRKRR